MAVTPDAASAAPPEKANGLATYFKVIFAPGDAFATLARAPMWGWAALVGTVLTVVGTIVLMPATLHFIHATQEQSLSQMSADQAAAQYQKLLATLPGAKSTDELGTHSLRASANGIRKRGRPISCFLNPFRLILIRIPRTGVSCN